MLIGSGPKLPWQLLVFVSFCSTSPTLKDPDALVLLQPLEQVPPERESRRGREEVLSEGIHEFTP